MSASDSFDQSILEFMQDDPLTVSYIQELPGTTDYETGEYIPNTISTPCQALLLDLTRTYSGLSVKFGLSIVAGDKELWLRPPEKDFFSAPLIITPGADKVVIGLVTYTVVAMTEINPTGSAPIVYNFMLRR